MGWTKGKPRKPKPANLTPNPIERALSSLEIAQTEVSDSPDRDPKEQPVLTRAHIEAFRGLPDDGKRESVRQNWVELSYILSQRAKDLAIRVRRSDFRHLSSLLVGAGIAHDKVFPKEAPVIAPKVLVNLFSNLGGDRVRQITEPKDFIDISAIPHKEQNSEQEAPRVCESAVEDRA